MNKNPIATITMENGEVMRIELYPQKAPNTVNNFIELANSGFYDGLCFHRIIDGFMIQGGDPNGNGMGGPGYSIKGEFRKAGFSGNDISHRSGVISMARAQNVHSAGSQFFICVADASFLDGDYAAFGRTVDEESTKAAEKLGKVSTGMADRPIKEQKIKSISVDTMGIDYPKAERV